ncbi:uncharacterized protein LOC115475173 isoform X2 [Microcaecilia unicolor]|uniref:Uncharacterized protein LOC115475173 isoform X2 n=1 Tax=Microcaecilia unicolor TaxID=1415580 RepID=A0A6P7YU67_9AMPH|nr:uncharacterized protein LOC115475173 isoform X2 [Microcaecilia unicolor]
MSEKVFGRFQASVVFNDVAIYFSEEEWNILKQRQRDLYKNVVKEIHQAVISLGYSIINPDVLVRISKEEEPCLWKDHDSERRRNNSPFNSCAAVKPDVLIRIKESETSHSSDQQKSEKRESINLDTVESDSIDAGAKTTFELRHDEKTYNRNNHDSETTGSLDSPRIVDDWPVPSSVLPLNIKIEKESHPIAHEDSRRRASTSSPSTSYPVFNPELSLWIKEEDNPYSSDNPDSEERESVNSLNTDLSAENVLEMEEIEKTIPNKSSAGKNRFNTLSASDIAALDGGTTKKCTKYQVNWAIKILRDFCDERDLSEAFEVMETTKLAAVLSDFYLSLRQADGSLYKRGSLINIRSGINRHLQKQPWGRNIDISKDPEFRHANKCLNLQAKNADCHGLNFINHKQPLSRADLHKLYSSETLSKKSATNLLYKVWFEIQFFFCRRANENAASLLKSDFTILTDSSGLKYVTQSSTWKMRSHPRRSSDTLSFADMRMYEQPHSIYCPVKSFQLYISKLHPEQPRLFQLPRKLQDPAGIWYGKHPVGERFISGLMKKISAEAGLSKIYTNHCIRSTCCQVLSEAGIQNRHIISISGHKSELSLRHYTNQTNDKQKCDLNKILTESLPQQPSSPQRQPISCPAVEYQDSATQPFSSTSQPQTSATSSRENTSAMSDESCSAAVHVHTCCQSTDKQIHFTDAE